MAIIAYRAVASDGSLHGCVFETDKAKRFQGSFCPLANGNPGATAKEDLYRTETGTWIKNVVILNSRRGSEARDESIYTSISTSDAREWLKKNDFTREAAQI